MKFGVIFSALVNTLVYCSDTISTYNYEEVGLDKVGNTYLGDPYSFEAHAEGTTVKKIEVWSKNELLSAIRLEFFDGTIKNAWEQADYSGTPEYYEFRVGERLKGEMTIGVSVMFMYRVGFISFETTREKDNYFEVGDSSLRDYSFDATGRFFTGLFGAANTENIECLGVYVTKPIESYIIINPQSSDVSELKSADCSSPVEIFSKDISNSNSELDQEMEFEYSVAQGQKLCWTLTSPITFGTSPTLPVSSVSGTFPTLSGDATWVTDTKEDMDNCEEIKEVSVQRSVIVPPSDTCPVTVTQCQVKLTLGFTAEVTLVFADQVTLALPTAHHGGAFEGVYQLKHQVESVCAIVPLEAEQRDVFWEDDFFGVPPIAMGAGGVLALVLLVGVLNKSIRKKKRSQQRGRRMMGGEKSKKKKGERRKKKKKKRERKKSHRGQERTHSRWSILPPPNKYDVEDEVRRESPLPPPPPMMGGAGPWGSTPQSTCNRCGGGHISSECNF